MGGGGREGGGGGGGFTNQRWEESCFESVGVSQRVSCLLNTLVMALVLLCSFIVQLW